MVFSSSRMKIFWNHFQGETSRKARNSWGKKACARVLSNPILQVAEKFSPCGIGKSTTGYRFWGWKCNFVQCRRRQFTPSPATRYTAHNFFCIENSGETKFIQECDPNTICNLNFSLDPWNTTGFADNCAIFSILRNSLLWLGVKREWGSWDKEIRIHEKFTMSTYAGDFVQWWKTWELICVSFSETSVQKLEYIVAQRQLLYHTDSALSAGELFGTSGNFFFFSLSNCDAISCVGSFQHLLDNKIYSGQKLLQKRLLARKYDAWMSFRRKKSRRGGILCYIFLPHLALNSRVEW